MSIERLLESWEARARQAHPSDAMLINKHIRELRETRNNILDAACQCVANSADASRYRWIRSTTAPGYLHFPSGEIQDGLALDALDAAIDAAMNGANG